MKLYSLFLLLLLISSCKQNEQKELYLEEQIQTEKINNSEEVYLKNFTSEDVAKFTIASIMGQPTKIIKVTQRNNLYYVSYIRKSDKKKFDYKIKIDHNKILWANFDGRWRDSKYDEKITFMENNNVLSIIQTFSDGSKDIQEYKKEK